jgi:hypothetical protein
MEVILCPEAFHSRDDPAFGLDSRVKARGDGSTVDQNGAGPTFPVSAPSLRSCQPQFFTEKVQKEEVISPRNRLFYSI